MDGDLPGSSAVIVVHQLHKMYRDTHAACGISFHVDAGQILGLVGPNGAGKTTTMRTACGIIPPTSGRLLIAGHDVVTDPVAAKRNLAYVPDEPNLFDSLTVREHLRFTAAAYRVPDARTRSEALLEQFDLMEKADAVVQELSRGMRQKVAICCAYLHDPKAIFFDEPLTGLDPRGIRTMKKSIREHADNGAAVVISSHLLALIEDMCTHIAVLHRGKVLFFGRVQDARQAMSSESGDATLEDAFFHLTEGTNSQAPADRNAP